MCQHQPNMMYANVVDSGRHAIAAIAPEDNAESSEENPNAVEDNVDDAALAEDQIRGVEENASVVENTQNESTVANDNEASQNS